MNNTFLITNLGFFINDAETDFLGIIMKILGITYTLYYIQRIDKMISLALGGPFDISKFLSLTNFRSQSIFG